jgi:hypothetical protein
MIKKLKKSRFLHEQLNVKWKAKDVLREPENLE